MRRELCQMVAGEILSAPTSGKWRSGFKSHPRIESDDLANNLRRAILRVVVEHDHFKIDTFTFQNRAHSMRDIARFVTGRNQHRTSRAISVSFWQRHVKRKIAHEQHGRSNCEQTTDGGDPHHHCISSYDVRAQTFAR